VNVLEPLAIYLPLSQSWPASSRTLMLQAATDREAAQREALAALREFNLQAPPPPLVSLQDRISRQMGPQRLGAYVLGALGTIAILLTIVGTYVLAESMAVVRLREMAIRAALGAKKGQLTALVLKETMTLVGTGLAAGLLLAWAGAGSIRALLYRVDPLDPATLAAAAGAILVTAVAVTLRPAVRAARVDLAAVLRGE
jgi:putative ABC transport system permease protein